MHTEKCSRSFYDKLLDEFNALPFSLLRDAYLYDLPVSLSHGGRRYFAHVFCYPDPADSLSIIYACWHPFFIRRNGEAVRLYLV